MNVIANAAPTSQRTAADESPNGGSTGETRKRGRVQMNVRKIRIRRNMSPEQKISQMGRIFRVDEVYMWQGLAQISVFVCLIESLSLGHYGQMFGRLSYGLLIRKGSQDERQ